MRISVIGSGSNGNMIVLQNENEALVLDCGMKYKDCLKAVDFNISKIVGVCVTHSHSDHAKYIKDFKKVGITVYKPYREDVRQSIQLGGFKVNALKVEHDGTECRSFLIHHADVGYMLYLTDLEYCKYIFKRFRPALIMVEANYSEKYVDKEKSNFTHVIRGHQSLEQAIEFVKANETDALQNVILCHLSKENIIADECLAEMKKHVKCDVHVATRGLRLEITDGCPF